MLEDNYNDIIKKAREGKEISLRTLADQAGVAVHDIIASEEGKQPLSENAAQVLGLSHTRLKAIMDNHYAPKKISESLINGLAIKQWVVSVGGFESNAYGVVDNNGMLLIDAVGASSAAMQFVSQKEKKPLALLITHGHFDHMYGIETVKATYPDIKIIHAGKDVAHDGRQQIPLFNVRAFKTPGHTLDGVCFLVNDVVLFVGDTIFAGSVGRPNYSLSELLTNIRKKLFTLPDEVVLAPGHGPMSTVGEEKKNNPFF